MIAGPDALPPALRHIEISATGCWIWTGRLNRNGYGRAAIGGREPVAHRAIYEAVIGPIPIGHVLDHLCRNRPCVNPWHMEPVTVAVNTHRGTAVLFAPRCEAVGARA